ncbi:MAG: coproporphyrinogen dehydrogenase HemZ [Oscillibacter sp.]|nr:coproporphyrinogen dehydrogenase HemZ [Oscillibacter sp.]
MKLYLQEGNFPWQPERYKYSVEQMMLMLFPGERPEYPESAFDSGDNSACFTLERGEQDAVMTAQVCRNGKTACACANFPSQQLDDTPEKVYHVVQHALKMAFYQAGVEILGQEPPWGALTGVRPVKLPTRAMKAGASYGEAKEQLETVYRVSPVRAELACDCAKSSLAADAQLSDKQVSVYIGVPFCPTRCAYCSFISADVGRSLKLVEPYLEQVLEEITRTGEVLRQNGLGVRSFYMGGGTPTTLSSQQMDRLLTHMEMQLPLEDCIEYTVEAGRPDTITREKLEVLKKHHIGRISINPQTLEEDVLRAIGRRHTSGDIRAAYALAREVGFESINMDLIAGLPRDSFEGFQRTLEGVLDLDPENITIHTLALKKGSTLMEKGGAIPSGEEVARMLELSLARLRAAGYIPYYLYRQKYMSGSLENVGWAKPGKESLYNIVMMEELQTVLSIGAGGITKLVDPENAKILRLPNPKYAHDYLASREKVLSQKDEITQFYSLKD